MGSSSTSGAILFYCVALSVVAAAATEMPLDEPDNISEAALASSAAMGETSRKLIDATGPPCPVRFDRMNGYEALGAKCRNEATKKECCAAFKGFACRYSDLLNNVNNGCADEMFYFIQSKGKLKPGTIFKNCLEGPHGLRC